MRLSGLHKGFTLVELVTVMILLSVLGVMTTRYISTGVDIYNGIADRDKSLNSIRFVMERLRREVANALPNSAIVDPDKQCLTFTPIIASSIYGDFPINPVSDATGTISAISDYTFASGDRAVVYLLNANELNDTDKVNTISAIDDAKETLSFSGEVSFSLNSPAKRVYIIRSNTVYCFSGSRLYRNEDDRGNVLMAEDVIGSFAASSATLQRNALIQVSFILDFDGQEVPIEQTLHINNTP